MVRGITDEIFNLIAPGFSVFGPMGINPNLADQGAIKSLHKTFTDEIVNKIMNRRTNEKEGGPFKNAADFFEYANREGARVNQEEQDLIPLTFSNQPFNFRIQSTGSSGKTAITITAITYDMARAQAEVSKGITEDQKKKSGGGDDGSSKDESGDKDGSNPPPNPGAGKSGSNNSSSSAKGPPRIVYWTEK